MKKLVSVFMAAALAVALCSCTDASPQPQPQQATPQPTAQEEKQRYTPTFQEGEVFPDSIAEQAAQRIDSHIEKAVLLMNSMDPSRMERTVIRDDGIGLSSEREKITDPVILEIYDIMAEKTAAFEDYYFDTYSYSVDMFNAAVTANDAFRLDKPQYTLYCDMKISGDSYYSCYYLPGDWINDPCDDKELIKDKVQLMYSVADRIIASMPQNLTDWEKCLYFAFVIASATEYDSEMETVWNQYQAYNALVDGKAVCGGYALAFSLLCERAGIDCRYCTGSSPYELGGHAWNRIETAEGPLYIDITWYDEEDIEDSWRQGKYHYLYMTQEDFDYYGYVTEKERR